MNLTESINLKKKVLVASVAEFYTNLKLHLHAVI
jgi:hypothetical protein